MLYPATPTIMLLIIVAAVLPLIVIEPQGALDSLKRVNKLVGCVFKLGKREKVPFLIPSSVDNTIRYNGLLTQSTQKQTLDIVKMASNTKKQRTTSRGYQPSREDSGRLINFSGILADVHILCTTFAMLMFGDYWGVNDEMIYLWRAFGNVIGTAKADCPPYSS